MTVPELLEAEVDRLRGLYHDESFELRTQLAAAVALLRESYKSDAAVAWLREYDAKTQPAGATLRARTDRTLETKGVKGR